MSVESAQVARLLRRPSVVTGSSTSLPFLYQTPTLCRPKPRCLPRGHAQHRDSCIAHQTRAYGNKGHSEGGWKEDEQLSKLKSNPTQYNPINLTEAPLRRKHNNLAASTTLTNRERGIFESIYRDLLQNIEGPPKHISSGASLRTVKNLQEEDEEYSEDDSLEAIFNDAVLHKSKTSKTSTETKDEPLDRRTGLGSLDDKQENLAGTEGQTRRSSEQDERYHPGTAAGSQLRKGQSDEVRRKDLEVFQEKLSKVKSSLDIWNLFQEEVLSKMRDFAKLVVALSASKKPLLSSKEISGRQSLLPSLQPWQQQPEITERLSILRSNYAQKCVSCLHALRSQWPSSPFVMCILPEIKSLGSISYALGASTELYNELLYIRWVHHRDLHGCAELLTEMLDRSVPQDAKTRAVFNDAQRARSHARRFWTMEKTEVEGMEFASSNAIDGSKKMTLTNAAWWHLQGVESGWEKWCSVEERAIREYQVEQQRRADALARAQQEEYDDDYEDDEHSVKVDDYSRGDDDYASPNEATEIPDTISEESSNAKIAAAS